MLHNHSLQSHNITAQSFYRQQNDSVGSYLLHFLRSSINHQAEKASETCDTKGRVFVTCISITEAEMDYTRVNNVKQICLLNVI